MFVGLLEPILPNLAPDSGLVGPDVFTVQRKEIQQLIDAAAADDLVEEREVGFLTPYLPDSEPVARPTLIRELQQGSMMSGMELVVRVISEEPVSQLGKMCLVEDQEGTSIRLTIMNYAADVPVAELLALNTFLRIKQCIYEPTGILCSLRVDHPSDVEVLCVLDPKIKAVKRWAAALDVELRRSATEWLQKAIVALQEGNVWTASRHLGNVLMSTEKLPEALERLARTQRALCSLYLRQYEAAFADCELLVSTGSEEDKMGAARLKAQVHFALRQYTDALKCFMQATDDGSKMDQEDLQTMELFKVCVQQAEGLAEAPLAKLLADDNASAVVADCLLKIEEREDGLYLLEDVAKGGVIMWESALVTDERVEDSAFAWKVPMLALSSIQSSNGSGPSLLAERLLDLLHFNPTAIGGEFHAEGLVGLLPDEKTIFVNTAGVGDFAMANYVPLSDSPLLLTRPRSLAYIDSPRAIFKTYSRLQPACLANTKCLVVRDVLTLTAASDLKAGTKLTRFLGGLDWLPMSARDEFWRLRSGMTCPCTLCKWDHDHSDEQVVESRVHSQLLLIEAAISLLSIDESSAKEASTEASVSDSSSEEPVEAKMTATEEPKLLAREAQSNDVSASAPEVLAEKRDTSPEADFESAHALQKKLGVLDDQLVEAYELSGRPLRMQFVHHRILRDRLLLAIHLEDGKLISDLRAQLREALSGGDALDKSMPCACIAVCECPHFQ